MLELPSFFYEETLRLTKKELKSHQDAKVYYICGIRILKNISKSINVRNVRDYWHYTGQYIEAHNIYSLKLDVPNETPVV